MRNQVIYDKFCSYCGDMATSLDHLVSYSSQMPGPRKYRHDIATGGLIPSCHDCNMRLGNRCGSVEIHIRAAFVLGRLMKSSKMKRIMNLASWSRSSLDELGPTLRSKIEEDILKHEKMVHRLVNLKRVAAGEYARPHENTKILDFIEESLGFHG